VDVRLRVAPAPDFLRQDMTVSVNVETGRRDRAIVVPNDALIPQQGNHAEVWLVDGGRAVRRPVLLGLRGLTETEVTKGLRAGDWILADGQVAVAEGNRVRVVHSTPEAAATKSATRTELPVRLD
jgi:HlyD family secretion protein